LNKQELLRIKKQRKNVITSVTLGIIDHIQWR